MSYSIKQTLEKEIVQALEHIGVSGIVPVVEHPGDMSHGDYATNAALLASKHAGKNPTELAEMLVENLRAHNIQFVESIDIAGPGFINFKLSPEYFHSGIQMIADLGSQYGISTVHEGKKILVEHSSPNLFKPFHIGHVMNNAIGESITRLARFSGADVTVISFPSDISLGIAKAIFIILEKHTVSGEIFKPENIILLGDAYVEGTKRYDEDESIHARVKEISNNLYAQIDSPELHVYNACKEFNMNYFEHVAGMLGSKFDGYIFESEAGAIGKDIVLNHVPSVFTKSEGAVVYIPDESKKNIHTAVFINSQNNPTYEAKDLGLLFLKFERYDPELSIFITDHQQVSHFEVVLDSALKINKSWTEKSIHRIHGRMSFRGQKMSSRLGGVPVAVTVLDTLVEAVEEKSPGISKKLAEQIAIGALKFSILRAQAGKNIDFDPDTSLSFEGDSGPYVQYTAVRAGSILQKAHEQFGVQKMDTSPIAPIGDVERMLLRFPEVVQTSIDTWEPHHMVTYLLILAQSFNSWYAHVRVLDQENKDMPYNIALVQSVAHTLTNGLHLLGIEVPEKM